ncbi:Ff.00g064690.m01.CDS01 [Fusarium sp. VM40]|nr:Ff.00g064690.m01.CDS01 [Fusarium sp. VM40]
MASGTILAAVTTLSMTDIQEFPSDSVLARPGLWTTLGHVVLGGPLDHVRQEDDLVTLDGRQPSELGPVVEVTNYPVLTEPEDIVDYLLVRHGLEVVSELLRPVQFIYTYSYVGIETVSSERRG